MYYEKYTNYFSRTFLNAPLHIFILLDLSSWVLLYLALLLRNCRIITLYQLWSFHSAMSIYLVMQYYGCCLQFEYTWSLCQDVVIHSLLTGIIYNKMWIPIISLDIRNFCLKSQWLIGFEHFCTIIQLGLGVIRPPAE